VTASLTATSKDGVLSELAQLLVRGAPELDAEAIRRVLVERERLASTGVGSGVAIPHGRLHTPGPMRAALAVHKNGVYFDAIDGQLVHVFIAIVGPDADPSAHLRLLARASRILRDATLRQSLIDAGSDAALYATFSAHDAT
jgi:PTS system nitrogen regulatory IIA component